jgi:Putative beta-barrel porin-2, OmpL-like. bbp2
MKFNKWTYGLAAVGAVSLVSAARADETHMSQLNTALSGTTISGYVDVAAQYNNGDQGGGNALSPVNAVDAFSVNSVSITLDKPLDESPWASGYRIDMNAGNGAIDALGGATFNRFNNNNNDVINSDFMVRQAYVALRTPLGNGIDWKIGAFDTILGYESSTGYANPNYTRSIGWAHEATSYVGLLGTYKVSDLITVNAGLANPQSFYNNAATLSSKNFLFSAVLTAPENFGVFKGATLTLGASQTFETGGVNNYYAGLTLPTPIRALAVGFAFDALQRLGDTAGGNDYVFGAYATYQATDKVGLALRAEYHNGKTGFTPFDGEEITATMSYSLWANVVSRIEARWDHSEHFNNTGSGNRGYENAIMLALNVIYKF